MFGYWEKKMILDLGKGNEQLRLSLIINYMISYYIMDRKKLEEKLVSSDE